MIGRTRSAVFLFVKTNIGKQCLYCFRNTEPKVKQNIISTLLIYQFQKNQKCNNNNKLPPFVEYCLVIGNTSSRNRRIRNSEFSRNLRKIVAGFRIWVCLYLEILFVVRCSIPLWNFAEWYCHASNFYKYVTRNVFNKRNNKKRKKYLFLCKIIRSEKKPWRSNKRIITKTYSPLYQKFSCSIFPFRLSPVTCWHHSKILLLHY